MCKEKEKKFKESVTSAFGNRADGVSMSPKPILVISDPTSVGLDWIEIVDDYNSRKLVIRVCDVICMKAYNMDQFFVELADGSRMEVSLKEYERIAKLLVLEKSIAPFVFESEL